MPSRRAEIRMSDEEIHDFLHSHWTMVVGTNGRVGWPHLVTITYGFLDGALAFQSYPKSQKVVNLRRDARMTCLIEEPGPYEQIRGVQLAGTARIVDDAGAALEVARSARALRGDEQPDEVGDRGIEEALRKRVAVVLDVEQTISWDHRRLGGGY